MSDIPTVGEVIREAARQNTKESLEFVDACKSVVESQPVKRIWRIDEKLSTKCGDKWYYRCTFE